MAGKTVYIPEDIWELWNGNIEVMFAFLRKGPRLLINYAEYDSDVNVFLKENPKLKELFDGNVLAEN